MSPVLLDSNYLYALVDVKDKYHVQALTVARTLQAEQVIADLALTEVAQLLTRHVGLHATRLFVSTMHTSKVKIETVTKDDLGRVYAIMSQYTQFDFVDACILTVAERLNITRIVTFDRRDFDAFKPIHCQYLEIMP